MWPAQPRGGGVSGRGFSGRASSALGFALHEATWLRPLLQHHVQARSQRHVHFDELRFGLSRDLQPTVRFRGLRIDNAPWADRRPMVVAGEVRFTFAWQSLTGEHIIVKRLELVDAQVDLEHRADGLRNWRLTRPDDRGPGKIRVLTLDARRSSLRFVQGERDLEIDSSIAALDAPATIAGHEGLPLTKRLAIRGTRGGQRFDATLQVSDVLSFLDSAMPFAVRGDASSLRARLHVEGTRRRRGGAGCRRCAGRAVGGIARRAESALEVDAAGVTAFLDRKPGPQGRACAPSSASSPQRSAEATWPAS